VAGKTKIKLFGYDHAALLKKGTRWDERRLPHQPSKLVHHNGKKVFRILEETL